MEVGERLPARSFLADDRFVEIRFFHVDTDAIQFCFVFGLLESASMHPEVREKLQCVFRDTVGQAATLLDTLTSFAVSTSVNLPVWNNGVAKFHFYDLVDPEGQNQDDLEGRYGVRFQNYQDSREGREGSVTVFWGLVTGKVALLYPDYSVSNFGAWRCGHLFYRYSIFEQLQRMACGRALSEAEIAAFDIRCDQCPDRVSDQVFPVLLSVRPEGNSECCRWCGQNAETLRASCHCRVCVNCAAIVNLRKGKAACPECATPYPVDIQVQIQAINLGIAGVNSVSQELCERDKETKELDSEYQTTPFVPSGCSCRCEIAKMDKIYCPQHCKCGVCLLQQFLRTDDTRCPVCREECFGFLSDYFQCSFCARKLEVRSEAVQKCICTVCDCGALLCCFCVKVENGEFICRICNKKSPSLCTPEAIIEVQGSFKLGCFCGEIGPVKKLLCGHMAHANCFEDISFCRICKRPFKSKVFPKLLKHYVS